jgi:hypothetical protein
LGELEWSRLFIPSCLELRELAYEWREAQFMVLTIEPCAVPSLRRRFQGKIKEVSTRASLKAYPSNDFLICGTRLVFQKEVVLKQRKIGRNPKGGFAKMGKDGNLEDGVAIQMNQFDLIVVDESVEEIIDQKTESALAEGGKHHDFVGIGCQDALPDGRVPLQYLTVREKMVRNKLADFDFIRTERLEEMRVRGSHDRREGFLEAQG